MERLLDGLPDDGLERVLAVAAMSFDSVPGLDLVPGK
jgi:hypothetical protein